MTQIATTPEGVPVITADPFSLDNLALPHPLHERLREAGPVVRLDAYGIWGMGRYEQVNAALKDWETFSSAAGAGLSNFKKSSRGGYPVCCWRPIRLRIPTLGRSSARSWHLRHCGRCAGISNARLS